MKEEPEETPKETPKPAKKQRRTKKVKLDENGDPIPKKKRRLNHQCAAVKICHDCMQSYRASLPEDKQQFIKKFCQLNRGPQGVMFNEMCVTMRNFLKEKYPNLEKWEDIDYMDEEHKPKYTEKVTKLLFDYVEACEKGEAEPELSQEGEGAPAEAEASEVDNGEAADGSEGDSK